ncbi:hypothetical protein V493_00287 [Pseudogymnoascus sp. VKM F-4281 (FW-2241)]|nr:hypothetical protein V493_00287 [Pseudogymnoascus sp. VKM F-4281 (FW-2241)]
MPPSTTVNQAGVITGITAKHLNLEGLSGLSHTSQEALNCVEDSVRSADDAGALVQAASGVVGVRQDEANRYIEAAEKSMVHVAFAVLLYPSPCLDGSRLDEDYFSKRGAEEAKAFNIEQILTILTMMRP